MQVGRCLHVQRVQIFHYNLSSVQNPGGGEIAPENPRRSWKPYAVDETVELDGWEH